MKERGREKKEERKKGMNEVKERTKFSESKQTKEIIWNIVGNELINRSPPTFGVADYVDIRRFQIGLFKGLGENGQCPSSMMLGRVPRKKTFTRGSDVRVAGVRQHLDSGKGEGVSYNVLM